MKLLDILDGKDQRSREKLNELKSLIGEEERLLWYPSAGQDYSDLLMFHPNFLKLIGINEVPNLVIHTEYSRRFMDIEIGRKTKWCRLGEFYIKEKFSLKIKDGFSVKPEIGFGGYISEKFFKPKIFLLIIEVKNRRFGDYEIPLIFFAYENYNFMEEVLIKHGIKIRFFSKKVDGKGYGNAVVGMDPVYGILPALGVKYFFADYLSNAFTRHFGQYDYYMEEVIYKIRNKMQRELLEKRSELYNSQNYHEFRKREMEIMDFLSKLEIYYVLKVVYDNSFSNNYRIFKMENEWNGRIF